ncbi:MAG: site-2 protease family protein [Verrucomicrobiales bacterium]|nr:site-2 protease family protein [Verrucomicrobiales bacterium]|tara:strand:+ start:3477 stop:4133 length:657 start_codon:yes stop_codon:yes gene_type:complete
METRLLLDGLIMWVCFIPIVTVHEWAHAWVAVKCGDDLPQRQGRVTLNPQAHICPIGTIAFPLLAVLLGASGSGLGAFIIGWGRPVQVNPHNFRSWRRDDILVSMAGPAMNIILAFGCLLILRIFIGFDNDTFQEMMFRIALLSLFLCFFNLLPIPPLDGSHVMKHAVQMKEETYMRIAQFGFIILIITIQIPFIQQILHACTIGTIGTMAAILGLGR